MQKSWRTTLGGSLETLGSSVRDMTMMTSMAQLGSGSDLHALNLWLMIGGSIICYIGKFFSNLYAADQATVVQMINKAGGDTSQFQKVKPQ